MTEVPYIERDCVFRFQNKDFEAGGAVITPERLIAYPRANGVLGDRHGNPIGTWRVVSTWRTPRSFVSSTMRQIETTVNGVLYTGRGAGVSMIYKGKRKARQPVAHKDSKRKES